MGLNTPDLAAQTVAPPQVLSAYLERLPKAPRPSTEGLAPVSVDPRARKKRGRGGIIWPRSRVDAIAIKSFWVRNSCKTSQARNLRGFQGKDLRVRQHPFMPRCGLALNSTSFQCKSMQIPNCCSFTKTWKPHDGGPA